MSRSWTFVAWVDASIIICTRNRARALAAVLASVAADRAAIRRELLVVDNGSTDETPEVVRRFAETVDFRVRHIVEQAAGHSNARNRGVKEAFGQLFLFTDDDVIVRPGWTDALVSGFTDDRVAAVGGRVIPVCSMPLPDWVKGPQLRQFALTDYGPDPVRMQSSTAMLPFGANFAVRRSVLGDPPFETTLGHTGKMSVGWEDWHLFERLEAAGYPAVYMPAAVVEHHFDASRLEWGRVRRAHFENGVGLARHRRLIAGPATVWPRRAARAARAYWAANRVRRRNAAQRPTAMEANEEFAAYRLAGECVESVLYNFPRLSEWAGSHLA